MIYGSQNFAVTFPGIQGSSNGGWDGGYGVRVVRGQDKSNTLLTPLNQATSSRRRAGELKNNLQVCLKALEEVRGLFLNV